MPEVLTAVLFEAGLLSMLFGFIIWNWQRKITRRDEARDKAEAEREKVREEREKAREELDVLMIRSLAAQSALSEATARAVQRIPDAHCNGDMTRALEYAQEVKHDRREFLERQGIRALHED